MAKSSPRFRLWLAGGRLCCEVSETVRPTASMSGIRCSVTRRARAAARKRARLAHRAGSCVDSVQLKCRSAPLQTSSLSSSSSSSSCPSSQTSLPKSASRNETMECFPKEVVVSERGGTKREVRWQLSACLSHVTVFVILLRDDPHWRLSGRSNGSSQVGAA